MNKLKKSVDLVLKNCMCLKEKENILIITDKKKIKIAELFLKKAKEITLNSELVKIPVGRSRGQEPPKYVSEIMKKYDVILLITTRSLSHTKARKNASKAGARIASMPNITKAMMKRAINVDYNKIKELNKKLLNILKKGNKINVVTKSGTYFNMSKKYIKHLDDNGVYIKKGSFGNLPAGEVCFAPKNSNGIFIIDASISGMGKVDKNVEVMVKDGFVTNIKGGKLAGKLKRTLKKFDKRAKNIAEFGIGTNYKARITGKVLEDEKVFGTCHIALGNNASFGGNVHVPLHIDCVIAKPTILVDNKKIMKDGKLIQQKVYK